MPFVILFVVSWIAFWLFADWKNWRLYVPVCLLALVLSLLSDHIVSMYPLWRYQDTFGIVSPSTIKVLDDLGVYPVCTYLFVQYVPRHSNVRRFEYFVVWTGAVILLEFFFCSQSSMVHLNWWNIGYSYLGDWLIFYTLYRFMLVYQDSKPSQSPADVVELLKDQGLYLNFLGEVNQVEVLLLEVEPGSEVPAHTHSGDEFSLLLQGHLEVSVGPERQVCSPGQWLNISRDVVHSAVNTDSQEHALVLSVVLSSSLQQKLRAHSLDQLQSTKPLRL